ncbi:hypothetical protein [Prescottella soli]
MERSGDSGEVRRVNFAFVADASSETPAVEHTTPARPHRQPNLPVRTPPDNEIPATLPLVLPLATTDDVAIWLYDLTVYSSGVAFTLQGRHRPDREPKPHRSPRMCLAGHPRPGETAPIQLTISLSDGTVLPNSTPRQEFPKNSAVHWLETGHGSSGADYYLSPLPPPGSLVVTIAYPEFGIPPSRIEIGADAILDAATRVTRLWPKD